MEREATLNQGGSPSFPDTCHEWQQFKRQKRASKAAMLESRKLVVKYDKTFKKKILSSFCILFYEANNKIQLTKLFLRKKYVEKFKQINNLLKLKWSLRAERSTFLSSSFLMNELCLSGYKSSDTIKFK